MEKNQLTRRQALKRIGIAGGGAALFSSCASLRRRSRPRPNILFAIADDWSWPHAGIAGDPVVKTPTFDRIAREGVLFSRAFCAASSCTPSRASILTGQEPWRLEEGANLWSILPAKFTVYPDLLEKAGYHVGFTRKGWGPGDFRAGGRTRNPAGPRFKDFRSFLSSLPKGRPFCFWFGSYDPHRGYKKGSGLASGMKLEDVRVPPFLPDVPEVRSDILDYYFEVQRFDRDVGELLDLLEERGMLEDTLVVMTSDNGMPFPRCKCNLYDYGTRMPLAVRWGSRVKGGRRVDDFIQFIDFAPTFLEAAGIPIPPEMTGRSFLPILLSGRSGRVDPGRDRAFTGLERHTVCRPGMVGYPRRAVRTERFLYIRNFHPERWPAGNPPAFYDVDPSPTKRYMLEHRRDPDTKRLFDLAFGKRPAQEIYDLEKDPFQVRNLAGDPAYDETKTALAGMVSSWMKRIGDPRLGGDVEMWRKRPYTRRRARRKKPKKRSR